MSRTTIVNLLISCLAIGYFVIPLTIVYRPVLFEYGLLWLGSTVLFVFVLLNVRNASSGLRYILGLGAFCVAFLNVSLVASFVTQGTPFNHAFVSHLDLSTLAIAWQTDGARLAIAIAYLAFSPLIGFWLASRRIGILGLEFHMPGWSLPVAVLAVILTNYPLIAIADHLIGTRLASQTISIELERISARQQSEKVAASDAKNIVLIYLESLEQNYLDDRIFEDLTPHMNALREDAQVFTNVQQYPGAEWTIGGIVSSQCGVPLLAGSEGNSILSKVDNPFENITCLAEYLTDFGYNSVYLGGATLDFAGKGNFLRANGYSVVLGSDELSSAGSNKWGMYDVDLYRHAERLYDGLVAQPNPFFLTLLTLDTHHPEGTPPPGCPAYEGSDVVMLSAVHCADILLNGFLEYLRGKQSERETIVAIMSDHLLIFGETEETLESQERRILFTVIDPSRNPNAYGMPATHFDIAPTLLEMSGITGAEFAFGQSLVSNAQGRVFDENLSDDDFQAFTIQRLISQ